MKTILFDLDGTLLPMDQDVFVKDYFGELGKKFASEVDPSILIKAVMMGTSAMVKNDGTMSNEDRFWQVFDSVSPYKSAGNKEKFDAFYVNEFNVCARSTSMNPLSHQLVQRLKERGHRLVLATNPLFPHFGTEARIKWAGLNKEDFDEITTYENYRYCKPNPKYYEEILEKIHEVPENCIMIGNDCNEDMVVTSLGMKCFLVKDCLINPDNKDIDVDFYGTMEELVRNLDIIEF